MKWVNLQTQAQYLNFLCPGISPGTVIEGIDPHLLWAGVNGFAFADEFSASPIPVIFEVDRGELDAILSESSPIVNVTPGSENLFDDFYTGFVTPVNLRFLIPRVKRLRIGSADLPSTGKYWKPPSALTVVDIDLNRDEVVIGIIDHGIAFANKHFAVQSNGGKWASRIERFWDQQCGFPASPPTYSPPIAPNMAWDATPCFAYGRELVNRGKKKRIDAWLNSGLSEQETYLRLKYLPAQGAVSHGTHVLGLAAGDRRYGFDTHGVPYNEVTDKAASAKIIAVQLPAVPFKDTSGAGLCVQILDAISYIHLHAAGRKVVINLSDGSYAGPHDGTSMLERALDQFYASNKHRSAFVVAAGNQFHERVHWQDTVRAAQGGEAGSAEIAWRVLPDDKTDSHLEIWPDASVNSDDLGKLSIHVTPPGRSKLGPVQLGEAYALFEDGEDPANLDEPAICMVTFTVNPPNSSTREAMIHIALAATRPDAKRSDATRQRNAAPHGIWVIELVNAGPQPIGFNAYIERDNPALGDCGPARQSHFVHPQYPRNQGVTEIVDDTGNASPVKRIGALNHVATAAHVTVVGSACLNTDAAGVRHPELARYSAAGPGRSSSANQQGVDLLAPGDMSRTIRGIRGLGTRTGVSVRMDGTSVAAPQVTRGLFNLMAAGQPADVAKASLLGLPKTMVNGPVERVGAGV